MDSVRSDVPFSGAEEHTFGPVRWIDLLLHNPLAAWAIHRPGTDDVPYFARRLRIEFMDCLRSELQIVMERDEVPTPEWGSTVVVLGVTIDVEHV